MSAALLGAAVLALVAAPIASLRAQHAGHDAAAGPAPGAAVRVGAGAVGLVTRAQGPLRRTYTEGYLTQPTAMALVDVPLGSPDRRLFGQLTLDFEGLTIEKGELTIGAFGEGYVDRRHPHTYLHEAIVGARARFAGAELSLVGGKGFAAFGTDDPMTRPFIKYPANHHLAQILERLLLTLAVRGGPVVLEGSLFNGDEPSAAGSAPAGDRFGDSWSSRLTVSPLRDLELSASVARVASPEMRTGEGLDQRKVNVAARWERPEPAAAGDGHAAHGAGGMGGGSRRPAAGIRYALVEWARTGDHDDGDRVLTYASTLGEAAASLGVVDLALRLERTVRPEEERDTDIFRTPRPHADLSVLGLTRWDIATVNVQRTFALGSARRRAWLAPFVEVGLLRPKQVVRPSVVVPRELYGRDHLWTASAGLRVDFLHRHARMGRYGASLPPARSGEHIAGRAP